MSSEDLLNFIDHSPTPFHAVASLEQRLSLKGFRELKPDSDWRIASGDKVYVIQGGSSIIVADFGKGALSEHGFRIVTSHTDSPNLRLRPNPDLSSNGYYQLRTEVYGGVLLSTWLDRDLSIAGRVFFTHEGLTQSVLVQFPKPLFRIPNLAIHLNRAVNTDGLKINPQLHLMPIGKTTAQGANGGLRELLCEHLKTKFPALTREDILSWDLSLYDTQSSAVGGLDCEFVFAPRMDNLWSCFSATQALEKSSGQHASTAVLAFFDHEECGSQSAQGLILCFLRHTLKRFISALGETNQAWEKTLSRSIAISADMAHAVHPNYSDRHEPGHLPLLGGGPVLKTHHNQSYATDGRGAALFAELCKAAGCSAQHFVSRGDMPCGSTVGPITAAQLGVMTLDVGSPLLAMHSIREMACIHDLASSTALFQAFFSYELLAQAAG
ncbi:MAG: M18 family aminopeptidase [Myxococcales bacterium]|nr:MAG: M18 family aminopeptidase [Myxococcales bacterium]